MGWQPCQGLSMYVGRQTPQNMLCSRGLPSKELVRTDAWAPELDTEREVCTVSG